MSATNLDCAMLAETTLGDYLENRDGKRDIPKAVGGEGVVEEMVTDLCHLLHLDEKTAGCLNRRKIRGVLMRAYQNFLDEMEQEEGL